MTTARAIAAAVRDGADPGRWAREAARRAAPNPYNAFRHVDADAVEAQIARVPRDGRLAGVPLALKDNLCDAGQPCGCASRILEGYRAPYTATAVERLSAAGAVVVARTNMDEFAMGSSTENSAYGPARNPHDETRAPGGSSGGSAVAVAAGIAPIALGSETGGSVRQPAALCGVVGFKPTYGRVSRRGLVAFASSLDVVSPFGVDVRDTALVTEVMAGLDAGDATSSGEPVPDLVAACDRGVRGLRIGVVRECEGEGVEPGVAARMDAVREALQRAGASVVPISVPSVTTGLAVYYVLAPAEASSNLARFDGVRYGPREPADDLAGLYVHTRSRRFGPEVRRRILLGTFALSAGYADRYYLRAQAARARLTREMSEALTTVDLLLTPTAPTVAFPLGARAADPVAMYLSDVFTVPASLAGLPAISVPCGLSAGLPVGAQLVGRAFDEATVFAGAAALEAAL
ncbi:MAG: Asp-tRNA(Asn)/Glu-tRNA(Gln) amidotransferase subunit GatA [Myxococcota bacterium]